MADDARDGSPGQSPLTRRQRRGMQTRSGVADSDAALYDADRDADRDEADRNDVGAAEYLFGGAATDSGLEADERQYPGQHTGAATVGTGEDAQDELDQAVQITDDDGTPLIVGPSSYGRGYQTVTVNSSQPRDETKAAARRHRRRRRNMMVAAAFGVFVALIAGLALGVGSLLPDTDGEDYRGPGTEPVTFTVNQGEGPLAIGSRLAEEDIVASRNAFLSAINEAGSENTIQPGDYEMRLQMNSADAAAVLLREGAGQVHYLAINRGMRLNEAMDAISQSTGLPRSELEQAASDPTDYGLPSQAPSLEGYLAPGEYRFSVEATAEEIFEQMVAPTFEEFDRLGVVDPTEQFRTVTVASILEAEALPQDYATVAGIIENRLQPENDETGGFLQIDASVIYGLGTRDLQFPESEKQNTDNEYNTYAHRGLPPGPIGAPSAEALDATANPDDNNYFYWITVNIETGETKFSEDYEQHRQYQDEYRVYCSENPEICGGGTP